MLFNRLPRILWRDVWFSMLIALGAILSLAEGVPMLHLSLSFFVGLIIHQAANSKSSIHIMTLIGYMVFIFAPALINGFINETPFDLFYATSFLIYILLNITSSYEDKIFSGGKSIYFWLFLIYSIFIAVCSIAGLEINYLYVLSPYVLFFILSLHPHKNIKNAIIILLFLSVFSLYFAFGWSGYGRTVTFGNMIVAVIYSLRVYKINVNKYLFSIASVIFSTLLTARKSFDLDGLRSMAFMNDSAFGPYRLAVTFIEKYETSGADFSGFFDQVIFTLLSFIPRELWSSKPMGFGAVYVIENMDQYLVDSGHSIASTLIGDHIYYLGWIGLITGLFTIYAIGWLVKYIYIKNIFDGALYVLLSCNMMVLVWGGMTSFSARIIYPIIGIAPYYIFYFLYKSLNQKKTKPAH